MTEGIGENAFNAFGALQEITLPDGLESIGAFAFCTDYQANTPLPRTEQYFTQIVLPDSIKNICLQAFSGCVKLKSITLPKRLDDVEIGSGVFKDAAWFDSHQGGVLTIGNFIYGYKGNMPEGTEIVIPYGIKYIADSAFGGQKNLAEVFIPDGVKFLGERNFYGCTSLKTIRLPSDLTEIPAYTFISAKNLTHIDIPSGVTHIGAGAFQYCSSLEGISLPAGIETIESGTFSGCSLLKEVVLPAGVKSIGSNAFSDCASQKTIVLPEGIELIAEYAFV